MSRIAKQPIALPEKVSATLDGLTLTVKGPLGELSRDFRDNIKIEVDEKEIKVSKSHDTVLTRALVGTYASHIKNMIEGVSKGFEKKLIIEGVGYRYNINGTNVNMDLGFSHPVVVPIPEGVKVIVEKNVMTISGLNKELVGEFAAKIRAYKETEPYKGKGIRYSDEVIRRKQGKRSST